MDPPLHAALKVGQCPPSGGLGRTGQDKTMRGPRGCPDGSVQRRSRICALPAGYSIRPSSRVRVGALVRERTQSSKGDQPTARARVRVRAGQGN